MTVSRVQQGAFGIRDCALSLPAIVGHEGVVEVLEPDMDERERAQLEESARVLRHARQQLST